MGGGRRKKIEGQQYDVALILSREELQGVLDLIAKRFHETGIESTKQDLVREALRLSLIREKVLPTPQGGHHEPSAVSALRERKN